MITEDIIRVINDLEVCADAMEVGNKNVDLTEVERRVNILLRLPLSSEDCLNLFNYTTKGFVHFQICKLMKNSIKQQFRNYDVDMFLRSFCKFFKSIPEVPYYVETSLIDVLCLVYKISLANTPTAEGQTANMSSYVEEFLTSATHFLMKRGYLIMKGILVELSNDSPNFMIGIDYKKQKDIKNYFQNTNLKKFLDICLTSFNFCRSDYANRISLIPEIASVMCELFSWNFIDIRHSLRSWSELITQCNLPEILFRSFIEVRSINPDAGFEILQCAAQLAAVKINSEMESEFLSKIIIFVESGLSTANLNEKEILGLSSIIQNFVTNASADILLMDKSILHKFLFLITEVTCSLCQFSLADPVDNLLQSWFALITNLTSSEHQDLNDIFKSCSEIIFSCYLKCHISAPEGIKDTINDTSNDIEDETISYGHPLIVGLLGRISIEENISLILKCLFSKSQALKEGFATRSESKIRKSSDDIKFIFTLLAEFLIDQDDSFNIIPSEFIDFSQSRSTDRQEDIQRNEFVAIVQFIEMFCDMEVEVQRSGLIGKFNSKLEIEFLNFLTRFSSSYVMYNEDTYSEMSMCMVTLFGFDSPQTPIMIEKQLEKIHFNLQVWTGQEEVMEKTLNLFHGISTNKNKAKVCLTSSTFWEIVKAALNHQFQPIAKDHKVKLLRNVFNILPLSAGDVPINLETVLNVLGAQVEDFSGSLPRLQELSQQVTDCFDMLTAAILSSKSNNHQKIYKCLAKCWTFASIASDGCHGNDSFYGEMFSMYHEASVSVLPFLEIKQATEMFHQFVESMKTYSSRNGDDADNNNDIICLIMKSYINFMTVEADKASQYTCLLVLGFSKILQLFDENLLEYTETVALFLSVLMDVVERCVHAIPCSEEIHQNKLLYFIEQITSGKYYSDVIINYLEFVKSFFQSLLRNNCQQFSRSKFIVRLFEIVLHMGLYGDINFDLYASVSCSLSVITTLYPEVYRGLTSEVIAKSSEVTSLAAMFDSLFDGLKVAGAAKRDRACHLQVVQMMICEIRRHIGASGATQLALYK